MANFSLSELLITNQSSFYPIIKFPKNGTQLQHLDLSLNNKKLTQKETVNEYELAKFINEQLAETNAQYGFGGYLEKRELYKRSEIFAEPNLHRNIHLGVDIWGSVGTLVYAPVGGTVHSFAFNNRMGDYGATIILQHQINGHVFYALYGHLALKDLEFLLPQQFIGAGIPFAHFGDYEENGHWPPHLHFQLILDLQNNIGDYPGVCAESQLDFYKKNCPDPALFF